MTTSTRHAPIYTSFPNRELVVFHYEIYLPGYDEDLEQCPVTTKYCFRSTLQAINQGRSLKKEYGAVKVRIENNDNYKAYWVE